MAETFALDEQFEAFIRNQLATGRYSSASEVIEAGLRLLEARESFVAEVWETIAASRRNGRTIPAEDVFGRVEAEIRGKLPGP